MTHILSVLPDTILSPPESLLCAQPQRLQVKTEDLPFAELAGHLLGTTKWIQGALDSHAENRVLVHRVEGISRSLATHPESSALYVPRAAHHHHDRRHRPHLHVLNIEPLYGHAQPPTFRRALPFLNMSSAGPAYFVKGREQRFGSGNTDTCGNKYGSGGGRSNGRSNGLWSHICTKFSRQCPPSSSIPPPFTRNAPRHLGCTNALVTAHAALDNLPSLSPRIMKTLLLAVIALGRSRAREDGIQELIGVGREAVIKGLLRGRGAEAHRDKCTHAVFVMGAFQVVHPVHPLPTCPTRSTQQPNRCGHDRGPLREKIVKDAAEGQRGCGLGEGNRRGVDTHKVC